MLQESRLICGRLLLGHIGLQFITMCAQSLRAAWPTRGMQRFVKWLIAQMNESMNSSQGQNKSSSLKLQVRALTSCTQDMPRHLRVASMRWTWSSSQMHFPWPQSTSSSLWPRIFSFPSGIWPFQRACPPIPTWDTYYLQDPVQTTLFSASFCPEPVDPSSSHSPNLILPPFTFRSWQVALEGTLLGTEWQREVRTYVPALSWSLLQSECLLT